MVKQELLKVEDMILVYFNMVAMRHNNRMYNRN